MNKKEQIQLVFETKGYISAIFTSISLGLSLKESEDIVGEMRKEKYLAVNP